MTGINGTEFLLPIKLYNSPDLCAKDRYVICILNEAIISQYSQRIIVNRSDIICRNINEYCQNLSLNFKITFVS